MQQTQTAALPRNNTPIFANSHRVFDVAELIALLRYFAFDFADTFGVARAMAHIGALMEGIPPLIKLGKQADLDEDTHCWQVRGIQEILLVACGQHGAEMKIHYIRRIMDHAHWHLGGTKPFTGD